MNIIESGAHPGRRRALTILGASLFPTVLFAAPQADPAAGEPPAPRPAAAPPALQPAPGAAPAIPAPKPAEAKADAKADANRPHFIFFQQTIEPNYVKLLREKIVGLVESGVKDVTLAINTNGGLVVPTLNLFTLMQNLPIKIKTHALNSVQSAGVILFLAGQERSADPYSRFLLHPAQMPIFGLYNVQQAEEQVGAVRDMQETIFKMYRERTGIPEELIQASTRKNVTFGAEDALKYGLIQRIGKLETADNQTAKYIFID